MCRFATNLSLMSVNGMSAGLHFSVKISDTEYTILGNSKFSILNCNSRISVAMFRVSFRFGELWLLFLSGKSANNLIESFAVAFAHRQQFFANLYPVFFDGLDFGDGNHV